MSEVPLHYDPHSAEIVGQRDALLTPSQPPCTPARERTGPPRGRWARLGTDRPASGRTAGGVVDTTTAAVYRGTSRMRNSQPPRISIGPWAYAYGRVLRGGCFLYARYPCTPARGREAVARTAFIFFFSLQVLEGP